MSPIWVDPDACSPACFTGDRGVYNLLIVKTINTVHTAYEYTHPLVFPLGKLIVIISTVARRPLRI